MITYIFCILILYVWLDAFMNNIDQHGAYDSWGSFFTQASYIGPQHKNFWQKYFPMFFNAWHLAKSLQYIMLADVATLAIFGYRDVIFEGAVVTAMCLFFIFFYEYKNLTLLKLLVIVWIVGVAIATLTGCKTKQVTKSVEKDSTEVKKIEKTEETDSTVIKPKVEIKTIIINPCDSNGKLKPINQTQQTGQGKLTTKTIHDTLEIDCNCDEEVSRYRRSITEKDSTIQMLKMREVMKQDTIIEHASTWYIWVLVGLLICSNVFIIYKYLRK